MRKTRTRTVTTLHVGRFLARETLPICPRCGHIRGSEELAAIVPPGANFGYDVMVHIGKALFLRHRTEAETVAELARKNIRISPREVSLLGMKFVVYTAIAHQRRAPAIAAGMKARGGYICHLDATCEGGDPFLMSSIDSLSEIVLGNVKLPAEDEKHIVPFLQRIKKTFGIPQALVHDMGKGILKAVSQVFPGVPDFICHFHFLRDIGKDLLGAEYDTIRKRLRAHSISAKLHQQARQLKKTLDADPETTQALGAGLPDTPLPADTLRLLPVLNAYTLIQWTLAGKHEGDGYGFPFDHPHLSFAKRIRSLHENIDKITRIDHPALWKHNAPYARLRKAMKPTINDTALWKAVEAIEKKNVVFEKLRTAMRIAPRSGRRGLNDEGKGTIRGIEKRVTKFRAWLVRSKDHREDPAVQKTIAQIDQYQEKLFADPIAVSTPSGPVTIQPQRTNNLLEQFFRGLKRANRRKTGNATSRKMLHTLLAETPLVRNLENPAYLKLLLDGETTLEEVFARIEIATLREAFRQARETPEKVPSALKPLIAQPDFPEKLVNNLQQAAA